VRERVVIVGPGRVGLALGYALAQADELDDLVYFGRRPEPPGHPVFTHGLARYVYGLERPREGTSAVFLAVPDDRIPEMAEMLARQGPAPEGCPAFHCSGALSSDALSPLHQRGYQVGSFHPLLSIAHSLEGPERFKGAAVAISGEPEALVAGRRLSFALGARTITIPMNRRPVYHAAGVFASNYLLVLLEVARRLLVQAGAPEDEAVEVLLPLVRGMLDNLGSLGSRGALTGPVARGDVETVQLHLRVLEPRDRALYRALGREALELARDGLGPEAAGALEHLFQPEE
jgi:predicted short-subunit dehydrogenase-like oxidoreductase (DUF2520 family)